MAKELEWKTFSTCVDGPNRDKITLYRLSVFGGWLVTTWYDKESMPLGTVFIPDVRHEWDPNEDMYDSLDSILSKKI